MALVNNMKKKYINAVASYFGSYSPQIKRELEDDLEGVETIEELLSQGHPKVKAYEYGYRSGLKDFLNHPALKKINDIFYITVNLYLLIDMIWMILKLKIYQPNKQVILEKITGLPTPIHFVLTKPIVVVSMITIIYILISVILVSHKDTERIKRWDEDTLRKLPTEASYNLRNSEMVLDYIVFSIAILFILVFCNIRLVGKTLLLSILSPYILMMALDMIYSYKERINHKSCHRNRMIVNLLCMIGLIIYVVDGTYIVFTFSNYVDAIALMMVLSILVLNTYNIMMNLIAYFKLTHK